MFSHFILLQYLLYMNPSIGLTYNTNIDNCLIFDSNSNIRSCNRIYVNGLLKSEAINKVKAYFGQRQFSFVINSNDIETIKLLETNGLKYIISFPAMSINLDLIKKIELKDFVITKINFNDENIYLWINIVSQAFKVDKVELSKFLDTFLKMITKSVFNLYIGYYNKHAVAAGMFINHKEIASLHWIGTLDEFRGKGFGFAITNKILEDAKDSGCKKVILLSSSLGKKVYEKIGFSQYAFYNVYGN